MARSIFAIVAGFLFIGALAFGADMVVRSVRPDAFAPDGSTDNIPMLIFMLAYVALFAISGCYLAARLAPDRPMRHALILGFLGLIFNIAGTAANWDHAPVWYHVVALLMVMPYAWLGGMLAERHPAARPETPVPTA